MSDEFILEDDDLEISSNRRPFLTAVGVLGAIGVLSVVCILVTLLTRGSANGDAEVAATSAAIETQNAIIAVTNTAVAEIVAAMETEAARPTSTPENTPTTVPTAIPTNTPRPTDTPVVQVAEEEEATPALSGTSAFVTGSLGNTPTPIGGAAAAGGGTLPQTGIATWGASIAAVILIGVLIAARRLRGN